ncbi:predicted protein [Pyrenophora tritici-repentis Pt-1C-BFP]|uniref:Uncharacterized protein n=1 Tax=Pyrenophora tritici-repentis (strain Pt-1C-BFP) TaxID=426418 RepID=B2WKA8_PYRTR|nr:uncharacterized protein PTRG_10297 [Pyrenophora tritici-repentis Pt-1C-BFP]EDU43348.1 predicted protein [Pyrenophora tritici-repentis Pt-1C-BFP]
MPTRMACGNAGVAEVVSCLAGTNNGRRKKPTQGSSAYDGPSWLSHALLSLLACIVVRQENFGSRGGTTLAAGSVAKFGGCFVGLKLAQKKVSREELLQPLTVLGWTQAQTAVGATLLVGRIR